MQNLSSKLMRKSNCLPASQKYLIWVFLHKFVSYIDHAHPMSKSHNRHCLKPRPAKRSNGIPCGCSSLQRGAGAQRWVCANHILPWPHMVCYVNFKFFFANFSMMVVEGHPINFLSRSLFTAILNSDIANWLVKRSIMYKPAMLCMELPVANL